MPLRFRILAAAADSSDPGPAVERLVDVPDDVPEIRFGRREGLEITLPFAALSGLHARLVRDGEAFVVEDLGSRNGTAVDEQPLPPRGRSTLRPGQRFRLANVRIVFEGVVAGQGTGARVVVGTVEGTGTLARRLVRDLFAGRPGGGDVARLTVASGPDAGRTLRLERAEHGYAVGRDPSCDLVLPGGDLSRAHASLTRRWEGVFVRDLGSKNGVSVAERKIEGEHRLRDGDRVQMGGVVFSFEDPEDRYLRQMEAPAAAAPPPPPAWKTSALSGVNLSHPDLSRLPMSVEIAPDLASLSDSHRPASHSTRFIIAIAAMVIFTAIGLLVFLSFLP
ncbi:MAG: hypothetical protein QOI66_2532 [Myxococcales bacterium]|jgi:pSer/pThr/pTyr-binding forkhead associated (FHA) protein|nr:hypothetical protein [Myxococcales bacterium]